MKVQGMDLGVCGVEQLIYAGEIAFDTDGLTTGVKLLELPEGVIVTRATAVVKTAFSESGNLTVGTNEAINDILGDSDVTAGTVGAYSLNKFVEYGEAQTVSAKFTGTGATAGNAEIYLHIVRIPV